jgi:RNA polymerase sigma-70 factor (ECF subfamily)
MQQSNHIFDSLLITEHLGGNKKAFSLLVKRWHPTFCRHAHIYVKDKALAQDVAQECWIIILKKITQLTETQKFAPWALTIVHRKAIDQLRNDNKSQKVAHSASIINKDALFESEKSNQKSDRLLLINGGIDQLNLKQRVVIELFYKDELNLDQIAKVLQISKGTVKSRLFYAREALKELIKNKES